jgi:hypothetical protein
MQRAEVDLRNPYWDLVGPYAEESKYSWNKGCYEVGNQLIPQGDGNKQRMAFEMRWGFVAAYAWTITDPEAVQFVAAFSKGRVVDPMAGTGYWAYLLGQMGVDVACYDLEPEKNRWHDGEKLHVPVTQMDGEDSVKLHPDRTLLLGWPPHASDVGHRILKAYEGDRVIYIGEGEDGCCGNDDMFDLLNTWTPVAAHRPVQWFGIHDYITVWDRSGDAG